MIEETQFVRKLCSDVSNPEFVRHVSWKDEDTFLLYGTTPEGRRANTVRPCTACPQRNKFADASPWISTRTAPAFSPANWRRGSPDVRIVIGGPLFFSSRVALSQPPETPKRKSRPQVKSISASIVVFSGVLLCGIGNGIFLPSLPSKDHGHLARFAGYLIVVVGMYFWCRMVSRNDARIEDDDS
ncbi:hypothetical protein SAMN05421753_12035 [Planctomicrobium piriforme]|uniref:Uncharacterized protein n=1 Tax=Planctomicrobium piriforme TaxID=1576369 RepID=A0A1I3R8I4_9PLAN|nr:hypothetical protein SAMN05421753_12035 [Planctomicrobium piriforme]